MKRLFPMMITVTATSCLVAACAGNSDSLNSEVEDKVVIALRNDVDTFDPHKSGAESGSKQVFDALYDTLVRAKIGSVDAGVEPSLAESWDVEGAVATFQLRKDLSCSDGTPLNADGVAESLRRIADPKTGSGYASRIFGTGGLKSVTADNAAGTITVALNEPYAYVVDGMAHAYIVCPSGLTDAEKLAQTPAPTGPYKVASIKRGDEYSLTRVEGSANSDLPKAINFRVITDDSTRANLVQSGEVDIAAVTGPDFERMESSGQKFVTGEAYLADGVIFNQKEGRATTDERVRQALALALDPKAFTRAATFNTGEAWDTLYTPNMECYTEDNADATVGYDLDQAKDLLREAGYGPDGEPLSIHVVSYEAYNQGGEYVADALRQLGIEVKLTDGTLGKFVDVLFDPAADWDVVTWPFAAPLPVSSVLVNQVSGDLSSSLNVGYLRNQIFDTNAPLANAEIGEKDKRCGLWLEGERSLLENVDIKPLVWTKVNWFFSGDVKFNSNAYYVDTRSIH